MNAFGKSSKSIKLEEKNEEIKVEENEKLDFKSEEKEVKKEKKENRQSRFPKVIRLPPEYFLKLKEKKMKEERIKKNLGLLNEIPLDIQMIKKLKLRAPIRRKSLGDISWYYEKKLRDRFLPQLVKIWKNPKNINDY